MTNQKYIGVFDSGVGGLSILSRLVKDFPGEAFVYLGDTARLPYGTKSKDTIKNYVLKNINYLSENYPLKAVVVACNSASSVLSELDLPIETLGVIEAGTDSALSKTKTNHIGLWATRATVSSKAYEKEILSLEPDAEITAISCPTLVTLVEETGSKHPLLKAAFDHYLDQLFKTKNKEKELDTLILGCTHFPFFKKELQTHLKEKNITLSLVDASEEISIQLKNLLGDKVSNNTEEQKLGHTILVTDEAPHFKDFIKRSLPEDFKFSFAKIDL